LWLQKVKTRVVRKTLNPVFDETFSFYGIDANQLTGISLHFVVLSFDRFSRDDVIGEVVYQLDGMEVESNDKTAVCVCRQIEERQFKVVHVTLCLSADKEIMFWHSIIIDWTDNTLAFTHAQQ